MVFISNDFFDIYRGSQIYKDFLKIRLVLKFLGVGFAKSGLKHQFH
jgi:hypothetical protein